MIKKLGLGIGILLMVLVAGPPLWYAIFPGAPPPELPAAGTRLLLPSGVVCFFI